jgi:hypothetical protein
MAPDLQSFEQIPINRDSIPQDLLDLESRERTKFIPLERTVLSVLG